MSIIDIKIDESALGQAMGLLTTGEPIIIPTDTVYGLAIRASDARGRERVFALKQRPETQTLAILVADVAQASTLVQVDHVFETLAGSFWPGGLTIVAPPAPGADPALGADDGWIGVRAPKQDWVRKLASKVGPIAATSANIHGRPTPSGSAELATTFPSTTLFDAGPGGLVASTVIRLDATKPQLFTMLREGHLTASEISAVLRG